MIKKLITYPLLLLNIIVSAGFLLTGYSYMFNPAEHPMLACSGLTFPLFIAGVFAFLFFWLFVKYKFALLSFATLVAGYVPLHKYAPLNIQKEEPVSSLEIISYNVHYFHAAAEEGGEDMTEEVVNFFEASNAGIICLQEAYMNEGLMERLRKFYPYVHSNSSFHGSSVACLSKYPIIKVEDIEYESKGNSSACFYIDYEGDTLRVINNHLETTALEPEDKEEFRSIVNGAIQDDEAKKEGTKRIAHYLSRAMMKRAPQAEAVARFVGENARNTIVCGDFNDTPISYSHYVIDQLLTDCYAERGWLMGFSYEQNGMHVRIDHAFCSADFEVARCWVDKNIKFSDHNPIRFSLVRHYEN